MGDVSAFVIKGDAHDFVMGKGMGDTSLVTCVSFAFIIKDVH
jgi:hypothetical protein